MYWALAKGVCVCVLVHSVTVYCFSIRCFLKLSMYIFYTIRVRLNCCAMIQLYGVSSEEKERVYIDRVVVSFLSFCSFFSRSLLFIRGVYCCKTLTLNWNIAYAMPCRAIPCACVCVFVLRAKWDMSSPSIRNCYVAIFHRSRVHIQPNSLLFSLSVLSLCKHTNRARIYFTPRTNSKRATRWKIHNNQKTKQSFRKQSNQFSNFISLCLYICLVLILLVMTVYVFWLALRSVPQATIDLFLSMYTPKSNVMFMFNCFLFSLCFMLNERNFFFWSQYFAPRNKN